MKTRLLRNKILAGGFGLLLALVLTLSLAPALIAAEIPRVFSFDGRVLVCADPMPEGTLVEAKVNGETKDTTTVQDDDGTFGIVGDNYFEVPGIPGDIIEIIVAGQVVYTHEIQDDEWVVSVTVDLLVKPVLTTASTDGGDVTTPAVEGVHGPYNCGEDVPIVATADSGYNFINWTGDFPVGAIPDVTVASTTITMNGNYSIMANFAPEGVDYCELETIAGLGGTIEEPDTSPLSVVCGTSVHLVTVPNACYEFVNWTGAPEGKIVSPASAETDITVDGDYEITANFQLIEYTLTTASTDGGDVTTPPVEGVHGPYNCGDVVDIVATEDVGYDFVNWTGDTADIADVNDPTTTIEMNGNYSITANFILEGGVTYSLTTGSTAGGSVTTPGQPGPFGPYTPGQVVPIEATPASACYEFAGWTGDTDDITDPALASTTITMNGNYSITASFQLKQFNLTTASTVGGDVTTPPVEGVHGPYNCGDVVDIVATEDVGYDFVNWTGDTADIADVNDPTTTIEMNGSYSIIANFALEVPPEEIIVPFNAGWNTFSTPISLADSMDTWDEFIALNSHLDILMVYGFNPVTGNWIPVYGAEEIEPLWGFYIKTTYAGVVQIIPNSDATPPPIRNLPAGVSLIGIAPDTLADAYLDDILITLYMAGEYWGYEMVVSPSVNAPDDWSYNRDDADPPLMRIGRAYWLVMANADNYVGSSTTPLSP